MRIRTIKALTFLESTGQVVIDKATREISATDLGKKVYSDAVEGGSLLAHSMRTIELSYQYIRDEARVRGEVN